MHRFEHGAVEIDHLKKDEQLGTAIDRIGRIEGPVNPDLLAALINSIIAQQISAKAALTVWDRSEGELQRVTAEAVMTTHTGRVQNCGISMRKAG